MNGENELLSVAPCLSPARLSDSLSGYLSLDFFILFPKGRGNDDSDTTILRFARQICQRI